MTKRNVAIWLLLVLFVALAIHTLVVGVQLALYSADVVDSEIAASSGNGTMRNVANATYGHVQEGRAKLYYSANPFTRWLANMSNLARIPLGLLIIASPYLFIRVVRKYNLSRRKAGMN